MFNIDFITLLERLMVRWRLIHLYTIFTRYSYLSMDGGVTKLVTEFIVNNIIHLYHTITKYIKLNLLPLSEHYSSSRPYCFL